MDKTEYCAVIKFFLKEGLTLNEIHKSLWRLFSFVFNIKKWAAEFKHGHTSLEDDPREGHPKSATTPEIIKSLTLRQLMSYIYGAPILDVPRSHTTTHHSR